MGEVTLGVDIGTSSTKGVLADPDGEVLATAQRSHGVSRPEPGWAEVDAEEVWWDDVVALCRELVPAAEGHRISGVCVSGVGPCLVLCGHDLRPLRPAILYGVDRRATAEIEELTERFGADRLRERCGRVLSSQSVGPKMAWVRRHEPDVWERAAGWYNSNSFVAARLTGAYVIDHHSASQFDPLYDVESRRWLDDWADEVAPGIARPELVWPHEVVGTVTADAADATGLPEGTPVSAGTIDAWSEAFSVGVRHPGDLMLMYGSTMFFVHVLDGFRSQETLWTTVGVEPESYTSAGGMATSGSITDWLSELAGGIDFDQLVEEAGRVGPGAEGLVVLPYFAGERTPIFDPRARGLILGLSLDHGRGHLFRAVYEGIAYGVRQILEILERDAGKPQRLVAVGGGTTGGLWTQVVGDVTGRAQEVPRVRIGASYGDALLAAIGTGLVPPETDWTVIDHTVEPDEENRERYDTIFSAYEQLYPATREQMHLLAGVQEAG